LHTNATALNQSPAVAGSASLKQFENEPVSLITVQTIRSTLLRFPWRSCLESRVSPAGPIHQGAVTGEKSGVRDVLFLAEFGE
jgi:hypothetical protein